MWHYIVKNERFVTIIALINGSLNTQDFFPWYPVLINTLYLSVRDITVHIWNTLRGQCIKFLDTSITLEYTPFTLPVYVSAFILSPLLLCILISGIKNKDKKNFLTATTSIRITAIWILLSLVCWRLLSFDPSLLIELLI